LSLARSQSSRLRYMLRRNIWRRMHPKTTSSWDTTTACTAPRNRYGWTPRANSRPVVLRGNSLGVQVSAARAGAGVAALRCFLEDWDENLSIVDGTGERLAR
jgi:hypothetical protein